jgi:hypothetical protein
MSRDTFSYTHGDTGTSPSSSLDFQANQRPDAQHFDWFWDQVIKAIDGHASEFSRLDSDNDGKVDNADKLDGNHASAFDNYGHWGLEDDDGNNTSITSGTDVRIDSSTDINTNISSTGGYTEINISHANTSGQGNVSAGGGAAITDVNLDGRGHVTSLSTTDFDSRWDNYDYWTIEEGDGEQTNIHSGQKLEIYGGTNLTTEITSTGGETQFRIQHAETGGANDTTTGGSTVIDDINVDGRGHVTNTNTQVRSLDDWQGANSNVNIGHNNLYNVNKIEDNGVEVYLDDGNSRVEIQDNNSNRIDILVDEIYLENGTGWFAGNHSDLQGVGANDHHNPANQDVDSVDGYHIQKNGSDGNNIINFKT